MIGFAVEAASPLVTVQDLGRRGYAQFGIGRSGAVDRASLALANRLVGNPVGAAGIEIGAGYVSIRARCAITAAVTGAVAQVTADRRSLAQSCRIHLRDGELLRVAPPTAGMYVYIALRGGIDVPETFASRSTDTLSALGPPALTVGQSYGLLEDRLPMPGTDFAPTMAPADHLQVTLLPGPRTDWFTPQSMREMLHRPWHVTDRCNRVAVQLAGPALARSRDDELRSEGLTSGAVQVPPSGQPLIFLADHPVTGGYPVIGYVPTRELSRVGQVRPGGTIHFRGNPHSM